MGSGSHIDQDGCHVHICLNPVKTILSRTYKAYDLETWYVAFGTWAHHNLYKSGLCIECDLIYGKVNFDALENA